MHSRANCYVVAADFILLPLTVDFKKAEGLLAATCCKRGGLKVTKENFSKREILASKIAVPLIRSLLYKPLCMPCCLRLRCCNLRCSTNKPYAVTMCWDAAFCCNSEEGKKDIGKRLRAFIWIQYYLSFYKLGSWC